MKDTTVIAVVAIIIIGMLAYLAGTGQLPLPLATYGPSQLEPQSISNIFHAQIDPYVPDMIHQNNVDCVSISGTWFDQADKIGCFNIPPGGFDSTLCTGPVVMQLRNVCEGIDNADWVCESTQVGCHY